MKTLAVCITERLSKDKYLLDDYVCYLDGFMKSCGYEPLQLKDFVSSILKGNYNIPVKTRQCLTALSSYTSSKNDIYIFAWICIIALIGPANSQLLNIYWQSRDTVMQFTIHQIEGDHMTFLVEYPPDGGTYALGTKITHTWIIKNTGSVVWDNRYFTCINGASLDFTVPDIEIPYTVPGEDAVITVKFDCTPEDEGVYQLNWRMVHDDGSAAFIDSLSTDIGISFTVVHNNAASNGSNEFMIAGPYEKCTSCGKEDSVVQVEEITQNQVPESPVIGVSLDFRKKPVRDEIPEWAGICYILQRPKTYLDIHISFDIRCTDRSINNIQLELHSFPANAARPIRRTLSLSDEWKHFDCHFPHSDDLRNISELRFIVKVTELTDEYELKGSFMLKNIEFLGLV